MTAAPADPPAAVVVTRFAVLHHTGVPSPHFDLLVEPRPGGDLAAWRAPAWPVEGSTPVERIKDHRPAVPGLRGGTSAIAAAGSTGWPAAPAR